MLSAHAGCLQHSCSTLYPAGPLAVLSLCFMVYAYAAAWGLRQQRAWPDPLQSHAPACSRQTPCKHSEWNSSLVAGIIVPSATRSFYTQKLLQTEAFIQKAFYREKVLHWEALRRETFAHKGVSTDAFPHGSFYTHTHLWHTEAFTQNKEAFMHRSFHRQTPLHNFTHWCFYIEKLHTDAFSRRRLCTKKLSRRDEFIQSRLCTKQLLHARASRPKGAYRQTLLHRDALQDASLHRSIDRQKGDR